MMKRFSALLILLAFARICPAPTVQYSGSTITQPSPLTAPNPTFTDSGATVTKNITLHSPNAVGSDLTLGNGYNSQPGNLYPIGLFRPGSDTEGGGTRFALDLCPFGTAYTRKPVWMDICNQDLGQALDQLEFFRVGNDPNNSGYWTIAANKFGTGSYLPLVIQGYGSYTAIGYGDSSGYALQVNALATGSSGEQVHVHQGSGVIAITADHGTYSAPLPTTKVDDTYVFLGGHDGTAYRFPAGLHGIPTSTWNSTNRGMNVAILVDKDTTTLSTPAVFVTAIGTMISDGTSVAPDASAALSVNSTTRGFLPFPMTSAQRNSIVTPHSGLVINNSTTAMIEISDGNNAQDGTGWYRISQRSIFSGTQTSNYNVTADVDFVRCNTTGGAFSVTLPAAGSWAGRQITIKDTGGSAGANNITVKSAGGNLDGTAAATGIAINVNYGKATYYSDATQWWSK